MKKILLPTLLLMTLILAACGGSTPASTPEVEPAPATQAEAQPTATSAPTEALASPTAEPLPTQTEAAAAAASVSFENDVRPIIDAKCIRCHGIESTREGLDMLNYNNLMAGSKNGPVVVPGSAAESLFVTLIEEGEMPSRGQKVTPEELQLIIDWVNQGALNN